MKWLIGEHEDSYSALLDSCWPDGSVLLLNSQRGMTLKDDHCGYPSKSQLQKCQIVPDAVSESCLERNTALLFPLCVSLAKPLSADGVPSKGHRCSCRQKWPHGPAWVQTLWLTSSVMVHGPSLFAETNLSKKKHNNKPPSFFLAQNRLFSLVFFCSAAFGDTLSAPCCLCELDVGCFLLCLTRVSCH